MACNETLDNCISHNPLINDHLFFYFRLINWFILLMTVNIFGVISNGINMVVFYRMGFSEKNDINISLFSLAISDFGSCLTSIWQSINMNPWINTVKLPFEPDEFSYLLGAWPHVAFTKITTLITAFITFQRCVCVWLPLKVKTIFTRRRVIFCLLFSYFINVALMVPIYYANRIGEKFFIEYNRSMLGLVFTDNRAEIESIVFPIINVFFSITAFIFIIISTILLVVKLKQKSKWRMKSTGIQLADKKDDNQNADSDKNVMNKDQKVSKMVVLISTLFIFCFLPTVGMQLTMWWDRRISVTGEYATLNKVLASFTFLIESVNAAMNVFIYYKNSSNYKAVFDLIFFSNKK